MYNPNPINTSDIRLSDEILELCETLAKNTHEVWSAGRIADGWTYGKNRDDDFRQHPCLVPYEDLPEEEKYFDRATAMETLKLILKLGFKIIRQNECDIAVNDSK